MLIAQKSLSVHSKALVQQLQEFEREWIASTFDVAMIKSQSKNRMHLDYAVLLWIHPTVPICSLIRFYLVIMRMDEIRKAIDRN